MVKEESFGIIPVRYEQGEAQVLLVRHQDGHWAFPKGHAEAGESPKQTAERELTEETKLQVVKWLDFEPVVESYTYYLGAEQRDKTVTYWLALVTGEAAHQVEELTDSDWFTPNQAHNTATFDATKQLCQNVAQHLSGEEK